MKELREDELRIPRNPRTCCVCKQTFNATYLVVFLRKPLDSRHFCSTHCVEEYELLPILYEANK